jgi:small neutral amino acid transporter SnatA (MarC family)
MLIARWLFFALGIAAIVCFVLFVVTGQARYKSWGVKIVAAAVVAGLVFFSGLAIERLL